MELREGMHLERDCSNFREVIKLVKQDADDWWEVFITRTDKHDLRVSTTYRRSPWPNSWLQLFEVLDP
jgi:hypothetical protein